MICYNLAELFRYQKLPHAFQTFRTIVRSNSSLFPLRKTQNSWNFIDLTCSISLLSDNLQLMNLWTREHFTVPMSNSSSTPNLKQGHDKFSKVEKSEMNGIIFFLQNDLSPVDGGKNIVKYVWWIRGVVSPNQRCWQRNSCLRGLNESKVLFSKFFLVKRQREAYHEGALTDALRYLLFNSSFRFSSQKISFLIR